ncbi:MAG: TIGR00645 family protein [Betaproteobacteria bacterium]
MSDRKVNSRPLKPLPNFIFMSRWLQVPLYVGLIVAQVIYVYQFGVELVHLVEGTFFSASAKISESEIMLLVLGLIDVVMISNLLVMVIVGGYETFVSRMHLDGHPDQPEWLSHVNAAVLKVKLATAIIGISSIHLLKSFINAEKLSDHTLMWQTVIHLAFIISALSIAWIDRIMDGGKPAPAHSKNERDDF